MEAPRQVEMILEHGSKSSTYKYALLKGLIDYIVEHPSQSHVYGFHCIPAVYLSKKFLRYYWPLWKLDIIQSNRERIRLIQYFKEFEKDFRDLDEGFSLDSGEAVLNFLERIESAVGLPTPYIKLHQSIRKKMVDQPLRKVRNVRGEMSQIFTAYHRGYSIIDAETDDIFDEGRKNIALSDRSITTSNLKTRNNFMT